MSRINRSSIALCLYDCQTGKVVLILENPKKEMVYYKRGKKLGKIHGFDVEYVTMDILNLDKKASVFMLIASATGKSNMKLKVQSRYSKHY